jgi:alpha-L-fucosidase 2
VEVLLSFSSLTAKQTAPYDPSMFVGHNFISRHVLTCNLINSATIAGAAFLLITSALGQPGAASNNRYSLTFHQPAIRWEDGLPTGNGTVAGLVYGEIRDELFLFNHELLRTPGPVPVVPDISRYLPEVREKLLRADYNGADQILRNRLKDAGYPDRYYPDNYHPAFDLRVHHEPKHPPGNYQRSVQLNTGEVKVAWHEGNVAFERSLFISRADDVAVLRLRVGDGGLSNDVIWLEPHERQLDAGFGGDRGKPIEPVPIEFAVSAQEGWLELVGTYSNGKQFGGLARIINANGTLRVEKKQIQVADGREVLVLIKFFALQPAEDTLQRLRHEILALPSDYDQLLARHRNLHEQLFMSSTLHLDDADADTRSIEELLQAAYNGEVPVALMQKMYDFGRYLLVASTRTGSLHANAQGKWNGDYNPPWQADYHNDIEVPMCNWEVLPGNLPELMLPLFDFHERMLPQYRINAKAIYGARGILVPSAQGNLGVMYPRVWVNWTGGAAWLAQFYYDYWLFTRDRQFLEKRAVPFLLEAAHFYEDFLLTGKDGKVLIAPSVSMENHPAGINSLAVVNSTMDVAMVKEVFSNLIAACKLVSCDTRDVQRWKSFVARLPAYTVNEQGALKEWIPMELKDRYTHRHLSHLYPAFPGFEITRESAAPLFVAAKVALDKRLEAAPAEGTGWTLANIANAYARLDEPARSMTAIGYLLKCCTGVNLFTYHNDWRSQGLTMFWGYRTPPPMQVDANMGLTAAVQEMLVSSRPGLIRLLSAPENWRRGEVNNLLTRDGIRISMTWSRDEKRLGVNLDTKEAVQTTIKFPHPAANIQCAGQGCQLNESALGTEYRSVRLPENGHASISVSFH